MVRNWDTVRAILLKLEAAATVHTVLMFDQVDGIDAQEVGYHMLLLKDAGLIDANILQSSSGDGAIATAPARGLTWEGHEFLDKIRDPSMWGKIKATVKDKGLSLTFDAIKAVAAALIKTVLSQVPSLRATTMNRDTAVKEIAHVEAMFGQGNDALHLVNKVGSEDESKRFQEVLGTAIANIDLDLLEPIYKQFPDLRPKDMEEIKSG